MLAATVLVDGKYHKNIYIYTAYTYAATLLSSVSINIDKSSIILRTTDNEFTIDLREIGIVENLHNGNGEPLDLQIDFSGLD